MRVAAAVQLRYTHRNIAVGTLTRATMSASHSADRPSSTRPTAAMTPRRA
jgi:hypothetical protein